MFIMKEIDGQFRVAVDALGTELEDLAWVTVTVEENQMLHQITKRAVDSANEDDYTGPGLTE